MLKLAHDNLDRLVRYPHIVIVAGVSGSGKSTFVEQLRRSELSKEIKGRLPSDVSEWLVVGSSMKPVFPPEAPGIVFQFDMNGRGVAAGRDFADDPALADLPFARAITAINLRPAAELMIGQLVAREGGGRTREQILQETFTRPSQHSSLVRKILRRWKPWVAKRRRDSCRRKIQLYEQKGWLEAFYRRWEIYLRSLGARGVKVEQLFLEPDLSKRTGNTYSWRIVSGRENTEIGPVEEKVVGR